MVRYVYTNDFLFHAQDVAPQVFHDELRRLFAIPFQAGLNAELESIVNWRDAEGRAFSRDEFYARSGIRGVADCYYPYDMRRIMDASWEYFTSRFPRDTVIIGSELGLDLRTRLTELGYTYINFWFHPYKLLDDVFFLVGSNSREIFERLERYRVPMNRMRFYSSYYSVYAERKGFLENLPIEENCCVFAGQTFADKSIQSGDRFLNITDFADRIAEVAKEFSKIYYVPHPAAGTNPVVEDFLVHTPFVQLLTGVPTYYLLASPKVRKVMALSSSVLYEAETFGKEVEYLFKPMFDIDAPYALNSFVSVYQSYFAPSFWQTILAAGDGEPMANDILLDADSGKFRDMMNTSFGFCHLGRMERMDGLLGNVSLKMAGLEDRFGHLSSRQDELASRQDAVADGQARLAVRQDELANQQAASVRAVSEVCVRMNELWAWAEHVRNSHAYRYARRLKRDVKTVLHGIKLLLPYGFVCRWLKRHRGIVEDLPLFAYPGFAKRLRRLVKFAMPYGLVRRYKRGHHSGMVRDSRCDSLSTNQREERRADERNRNLHVFYVDSAVANQDELNSRMAAEVTKRGIPYAN